MSKALERIEQYTRDQLRNLLLQCTKKQQTFFYRMYPSIDKIPPEKLPWAIRQCENTLAKKL
jgi:3-methyladenine DNA glycosylase AlkC